MMKRKQDSYSQKDESKKVKPTAGYVSDHKLLPRVRQYINSIGPKKQVTVSTIAESLQRQYGEYARKKKNAFLKSVERAYSIIQKDNDDEKGPLSESEDSFSSDVDQYVQYEDTNSINSYMSTMYKKSPKNGIGVVRGDQLKSETTHTPNKDTGAGFCIDREGLGSAVETPLKQDDLAKKNKTKMKKVSKTKERKTEATQKEKGPQVQTSSVTFADVGGNEACLKEVCKLLVHLRHPEVYQCLGVVPPRGFLLHGPPGCGKTLLANAIAGELGLPFLKLAATEIVSGVSGESEEKIRDLFDKAMTTAPCIVFIDEIDAITPKRETASKDMERRIVSQLLSCMDDLSAKSTAHVLVIGATNRPDSLDPALRRAGRFDREISLGIPNEKGRKSILQVLCKNLKLETDFNFHHLARMSPGFVGADLTALTRDAAMVAVNRVFLELQHGTHDEAVDMVTGNENKGNTSVAQQSCGDPQPITQLQTPQSDLDINTALLWLKEQPPLTESQLQDMNITMADFEEALKHVQPSAKREGFATIPDVTWDDIGALHSVREELQLAIMAPVKHPDQFEELGLSRAQGILLAGPPGCGKTLLAKAIANESGINFISVKGPELLNMYVGESERAVRQVFQRARNSAPCVIFFDELDALCPKRSDAGEGGASVRVVNQMLTEMDGLEERKQVFIMGATNRPDIIDPAILRPGRLDKILYVGLPKAEERLDIIRTITKNGSKPQLHCDVKIEDLATDNRCDRYSGADLAALIREASVAALTEMIKESTSTNKSSPEVTRQHFEIAFNKVKPSVSLKDEMRYKKMREQLSTG